MFKFQFDRTWFYQITKWVYSSCVDYDNIFASSEKHVDFATCTCINHSGRWCISAAGTCKYLSSGSYIWSIFKERIMYREKWKFVHDFDAQYHKHFILDSLKHWILNMYNYYSIVKNNSKLIMPKNNHGYKNKTWSFLFFPAVLH